MAKFIELPATSIRLRLEADQTMLLHRRGEIRKGDEEQDLFAECSSRESSASTQF